MRADVYRPGGKPKAAVLMVHAGGWRGGSKDDLGDAAIELTRYGYVAIPVEYRLLGEAPWPAQIQDVRAAVRWARDNAAEFEIDPSNIVLEGFSAGGHLSLLTAGRPVCPHFDYPEDMASTPAEVAAVVTFYAPVEFQLVSPPEGVGLASRLLGDAATAEDAVDISPIAHVSAAYPPAFLIHGTVDRLVSPVAGLRLYSRLRELGVPAELHMVAQQAHDFIVVPSSVLSMQSEVATFIDRLVVESDRYREENLQFNKFARNDVAAAQAKS